MRQPREPERNKEVSTTNTRGTSRGYLYLLLSLHLPAIALGFGTGMTTPVLPVFAKSFDVGPSVASLVFVANLAGGVVASLPTGYVLDRFGRRKVLLAGPIVTAASALLMATSGTFAELLLYRFIGGLGTQMWTLSRLTVVADTGASGERGRQITSMFGVQRVGTLAGPLIGGLVAAAWGIRLPFVLQGAAALLAVVPSFFVVRETASARPATRAGGRRGDAGEESYSWRTLLAPPIPLIFSIQLISTIARGGAIGGGTVFIFAAYAYGTGPATLGLLSSAMAAIGIPVTFAAGFLMDRFGRKFTIVPGHAVLGASMALLAATALASLSFSFFIVGFVALQVMNSLLSGSWQVLGTDIAPPHARGRFFGAGRMVTQAGFMSNPLSFSLLTALSGFPAAFAFLGAAGFLSSLFIGVFIKETLVKE